MVSWGGKRGNMDLRIGDVFAIKEIQKVDVVAVLRKCLHGRIGDRFAAPKTKLLEKTATSFG